MLDLAGLAQLATFTVNFAKISEVVLNGREIKNIVKLCIAKNKDGNTTFDTNFVLAEINKYILERTVLFEQIGEVSNE